MLAELLLYLSFLGSFAFIRTSAHLIRAQVKWWPGNVEVGNTHVHHLVWGILLMLIAGWGSIGLDPESPAREVLAVLFGIGAGLTLDEFALWLHLQDVYWKPQGKQSIQAVAVVAVAGLVLLLGLRFWLDLGQDAGRDAADAIAWAMSSAWLVAVITAAACFFRGMRKLAVVALLVPPVGWLALALQGAETIRSAESHARETSSETSDRGSRKRVST